MDTKKTYPVEEAANDLECFIKLHIKDSKTLDALLEHLEMCRAAGRLDFRYLHEEIIRYRKNFSDYFPYSPHERKMVDDLFYFWG